MTDTLTIYVDPAGETRWAVAAPNGEPVAASTEGYKAPRDAIANAARHLVLTPTEHATIFDVHPLAELADSDQLVDAIVDHLIEPDPDAPPSVNSARRRFTGGEVRGVLRALAGATITGHAAHPEPQP